MSLSRAIRCRPISRLSVTGLHACPSLARALVCSPSRPLASLNWNWNRPAGLGLSSRRWVFSTIESRSAWEALGVTAPIIDKMKVRYPHIQTPTPAQRAFLLALGGDRDVFLRDGMGRGKTFALALAACILASQTETVLILAPSDQLVDLFQTHLHNLSPDPMAFKGRVHVTTPQSLTRDHQRIDGWSTIMIDEPETMLAPLPSRNLPAPALRSHPFNRHPPPLATFLDHPRGAKSGRRMIWVGAEMNSLLRRVVRQRGWTRMNTLELDFGGMPSGRAKKDIEGILGQPPSHGSGDTSAKITHSALVVNPRNGRVETYPRVSSLGATTSIPAFRSGRPDIDQTMIEAIMTLEDQADSSERPGTISLVLPPEGYPLDLLAAQIKATATSLNSSLTCSVLDPSTSSSFAEGASPSSTMLLAPRSSVPGLDIPNLGRIYLINALDLASLSPSRRERGGLKRRLGWYDVVSGRLGRLGSVTEKEGGRVVSLVMSGSGEEVGLDAILARRTAE